MTKCLLKGVTEKTCLLRSNELITLESQETSGYRTEITKYGYKCNAKLELNQY